LSRLTNELHVHVKDYSKFIHTDLLYFHTDLCTIWTVTTYQWHRYSLNSTLSALLSPMIGSKIRRSGLDNWLSR